MKKYKCTICGYIYIESNGIPDSGIATGTKWEDIPDTWVCPWCGASKGEFELIEPHGKTPVLKQESTRVNYEKNTALDDDMREMTNLEVSALCSNLAKGCEKQYMANEAKLYFELSDYYKSKSLKGEANNFESLRELIENDLSVYEDALRIAKENSDRGALRSLVWSEKVTKMLSSILKKYKNQGDSMLENTNIYVCEICGFIYIGDTPPEVCPVCKVPNFKMKKI